MAILAAGVRYDQNGIVQAVIVITDDDGVGHPDHLNPHKLHAASQGHRWLNIPAALYETFKNPQDLADHINKSVLNASIA